MSSIIAVQRQIRRALQTPLYEAAVAFPLVNLDGEPLIKWGRKHFDASDPRGYLSVEIGFSSVVVHTIGPNPMLEAVGTVTINIRSPIERAEDGNDALLGIIDAAYPYASTPSFEGVSVTIDKTEPRGYGTDGPWQTGLYATGWNIYRRN